MTGHKKEGILKRFFGAGKNNCCSIRIEEVKEETQDTCSGGCCGSDTKALSQEVQKEKPKDCGSTSAGCCGH